MNDEKVITTEVQEKTGDASTQPEVDYAKLLKEKDDEIAQIRSDKENYRKGLLKAKGKILEDDAATVIDDKIDIETLIETKLSEKLANTEEARIQREKDVILSDLLKKNSEMAIALKNRGQVVSTTGGANQGKLDTTVDDKFFSPDQISELKRKGLDPEKVKANLLRSSGSTVLSTPHKE